jgi:hypothetical protein
MVRKGLISCSLCLVFLVPAFAQNRTIADIARDQRARQRESATAINAVSDTPQQVLSGDVLADAMNLCGVRRQLAHVFAGASQTMRDLTMRDFSELPTATEYEDAIVEAMNPDRLVPLMERYITANSKAETLAEVSKWCASPFGTKVTATELRSATEPDKTARRMQYRKMLNINPPSNRRRELLRGMVKDTAAVEYNIHALTQFMKGVRSVAVVGGQKLPLLPPDFEAGLTSRLTPAFAEAALLGFLYTYRSLSDDEVAAVAQMVRTPAYTAFNRTVCESILLAFEDVGKHIGAELSKLQLPKPSGN